MRCDPLFFATKSLIQKTVNQVNETLFLINNNLQNFIEENIE